MNDFETQQGLNDVVTAKVQRMIDGKQQTVQQTLSRLIDEGQNGPRLYRPDRGGTAAQRGTSRHILYRTRACADEHAAGTILPAFECRGAVS